MAHSHLDFINYLPSKSTSGRYFFEKPKCDVHQKNLAKSLNELYTEPAPSASYPFDLPNEFPLTRSVSTTTDIFSNCGSAGGFTTTNSNSHKSLRTFTPQLNKRNRQMDCQLQNRNYKSISRDGSHDSLNSGGITMTKGILTNREKSKDELFMEFCKKAGQRPKPKDIYFIDRATYDDAAEKEVFVVENYATIRKNRRNSNLNGIQKSTNINNSNQSLKDSNNAINIKKSSYPLNNLFDSERFGGSIERTAAFLNNSRDNYFSQNRNNSRDSNLYSSRTLPRDFLKRNFDYDGDDYNNRRVTANGLFTPYNASMTLPGTDTPKRISNETTDYYKKSYDTLASRNTRQRDAHTGSEDALSVHWPNAIPGSPASFSNRFNYNTQYSPNTQRKPALMSTFYSQHFPRTLKQPTPVHKINVFTDDNNKTGDIMSHFNDNSGINEYENELAHNNHIENGNGSTNGDGNDEFGMFDLDRLERERRKSHASLFEIEIDFENGTPV